MSSVFNILLAWRFIFCAMTSPRRTVIQSCYARRFLGRRNHFLHVTSLWIKINNKYFIFKITLSTLMKNLARMLRDTAVEAIAVAKSIEVQNNERAQNRWKTYVSVRS